MLTASACACAIGVPMLPVVSTATMMSALGGRPSRWSVLFTVVDAPACNVVVTTAGVNVSAAKAGADCASTPTTSTASAKSTRRGMNLLILSSLG